MKKIFHKIKVYLNQYFGSSSPVEERVFNIALFGGFFVALGSAIGNGVNKLDPLCLIFTIIGVILMAFIVLYSLMRHHISVSSILASLVLNFILFPSIFFTSGGLYSGMILFFALGLFACTFIPNSIIKHVIFIASSVFYGFIIYLSMNQLSYLVHPLNKNQWVFDSILCLLIIGGFSFFVLNTFNYEAKKERKRVNDLNSILSEKAIKDELTGIYNRRYFEETISRIMNNIEYKEFSIAMLDIDFFKRFNDLYGHLTGDLVLKIVASTITNELGPKGIVARYGGEEFIVFIKNNLEESYLLLEELRKKMEKTLFSNEIKESITISGGVKQYDGLSDYLSLVSEADKCLYKAKENGRNQICK